MQDRNWTRRTFLSSLGLGAAAALSGCTQNTGGPQTKPAPAPQPRPAPKPTPTNWKNEPEPTPEQVSHMLEPNVLGVSCFYDPFNPWIWNTQHTQVRGIKVNALYLRGPNYTGVFGDGTLKPKLYVATRDEQGKQEYKLLKEWSFDVQQAMLFRSKKRMKAGWGYALFLDWGDMDLSGQAVRLTISFERKDGIVISGSKKDFRVPKPTST